MRIIETARKKTGGSASSLSAPREHVEPVPQTEPADLTVREPNVAAERRSEQEQLQLGVETALAKAVGHQAALAVKEERDSLVDELARQNAKLTVQLQQLRQTDDEHIELLLDRIAELERENFRLVKQKYASAAQQTQKSSNAQQAELEILRSRVRLLEQAHAAPAATRAAHSPAAVIPGMEVVLEQVQGLKDQLAALLAATAPGAQLQLQPQLPAPSNDSQDRTVEELRGEVARLRAELDSVRAQPSNADLLITTGQQQQIRSQPLPPAAQPDLAGHPSALAPANLGPMPQTQGIWPWPLPKAAGMQPVPSTTRWVSQVASPELSSGAQPLEGTGGPALMHSTVPQLASVRRTAVVTAAGAAGKADSASHTPAATAEAAAKAAAPSPAQGAAVQLPAQAPEPRQHVPCVFGKTVNAAAQPAATPTAKPLLSITPLVIAAEQRAAAVKQTFQPGRSQDQNIPQLLPATALQAASQAPAQPPVSAQQAAKPPAGVKAQPAAQPALDKGQKLKAVSSAGGALAKPVPSPAAARPAGPPSPRKAQMPSTAQQAERGVRLRAQGAGAAEAKHDRPKADRTSAKDERQSQRASDGKLAVSSSPRSQAAKPTDSNAAGVRQSSDGKPSQLPSAKAEASSSSDQIGRQVAMDPAGSLGVEEGEILPGREGEVTLTMLAGKPAKEQKRLIGERLIPLVQQQLIDPQPLRKIIRMLLELDNAYLLGLLGSPEALASKVAKVLRTLQHTEEQRDKQEGLYCVVCDVKCPHKLHMMEHMSSKKHYQTVRDRYKQLTGLTLREGFNDHESCKNPRPTHALGEDEAARVHQCPVCRKKLHFIPHLRHLWHNDHRAATGSARKKALAELQRQKQVQKSSAVQASQPPEPGSASEPAKAQRKASAASHPLEPANMKGKASAASQPSDPANTKGKASAAVSQPPEPANAKGKAGAASPPPEAVGSTTGKGSRTPIKWDARLYGAPGWADQPESSATRLPVEQPQLSSAPKAASKPSGESQAAAAPPPSAFAEQQSGQQLAPGTRPPGKTLVGSAPLESTSQAANAFVAAIKAADAKGDEVGSQPAVTASASTQLPADTVNNTAVAGKPVNPGKVRPQEDPPATAIAAASGAADSRPAAVSNPTTRLPWQPVSSALLSPGKAAGLGARLDVPPILSELDQFRRRALAAVAPATAQAATTLSVPVPRHSRPAAASGSTAAAASATSSLPGRSADMSAKPSVDKSLAQAVVAAESMPSAHRGGLSASPEKVELADIRRQAAEAAEAAQALLAGIRSGAPQAATQAQACGPSQAGTTSGISAARKPIQAGRPSPAAQALAASLPGTSAPGASASSRAGAAEAIQPSVASHAARAKGALVVPAAAHPVTVSQPEQQRAAAHTAPVSSGRGVAALPAAKSLAAVGQPAQPLVTCPPAPVTDLKAGAPAPPTKTQAAAAQPEQPLIAAPAAAACQVKPNTAAVSSGNALAAGDGEQAQPSSKPAAAPAASAPGSPAAGSSARQTPHAAQPAGATAASLAALPDATSPAASPAPQRTSPAASEPLAGWHPGSSFSVTVPAPLPEVPSPTAVHQQSRPATSSDAPEAAETAHQPAVPAAASTSGTQRHSAYAATAPTGMSGKPTDQLASRGASSSAGALLSVHTSTTPAPVVGSLSRAAQLGARSHKTDTGMLSDVPTPITDTANRLPALAQPGVMGKPSGRVVHQRSSLLQSWPRLKRLAEVPVTPALPDAMPERQADAQPGAEAAAHVPAGGPGLAEQHKAAAAHANADGAAEPQQHKAAGPALQDQGQGQQQVAEPAARATPAKRPAGTPAEGDAAQAKRVAVPPRLAGEADGSSAPGETAAEFGAAAADAASRAAQVQSQPNSLQLPASAGQAPVPPSDSTPPYTIRKSTRWGADTPSPTSHAADQQPVPPVFAPATEQAGAVPAATATSAQHAESTAALPSTSAAPAASARVAAPGDSQAFVPPRAAVQAVASGKESATAADRRAGAPAVQGALSTDGGQAKLRAASSPAKPTPAGSASAGQSKGADEKPYGANRAGEPAADREAKRRAEEGRSDPGRPGRSGSGSGRDVAGRALEQLPSRRSRSRSRDRSRRTRSRSPRRPAQARAHSSDPRHPRQTRARTPERGLPRQMTARTPDWGRSRRSRSRSPAHGKRHSRSRSRGREGGWPEHGYPRKEAGSGRSAGGMDRPARSRSPGRKRARSGSPNHERTDAFEAAEGRQQVRQKVVPSPSKAGSSTPGKPVPSRGAARPASKPAPLSGSGDKRPGGAERNGTHTASTCGDGSQRAAAKDGLDKGDQAAQARSSDTDRLDQPGQASSPAAPAPTKLPCAAPVSGSVALAASVQPSHVARHGAMPPNTTAQPAVESPPLPPDPEPQAMQQQGPQQEMPGEPADPIQALMNHLRHNTGDIATTARLLERCADTVQAPGAQAQSLAQASEPLPMHAGLVEEREQQAQQPSFAAQHHPHTSLDMPQQAQHAQQQQLFAPAAGLPPWHLAIPEAAGGVVGSQPVPGLNPTHQASTALASPQQPHAPGPWHTGSQANYPASFLLGQRPYAMSGAPVQPAQPQLQPPAVLSQQGQQRSVQEGPPLGSPSRLQPVLAAQQAASPMSGSSAPHSASDGSPWAVHLDAAGLQLMMSKFGGRLPSVADLQQLAHTLRTDQEKVDRVLDEVKRMQAAQAADNSLAKQPDGSQKHPRHYYATRANNRRGKLNAKTVELKAARGEVRKWEPLLPLLSKVQEGLLQAGAQGAAQPGNAAQSGPQHSSNSSGPSPQLQQTPQLPLSGGQVQGPPQSQSWPSQEAAHMQGHAHSQAADVSRMQISPHRQQHSMQGTAQAQVSMPFQADASFARGPGREPGELEERVPHGFRPGGSLAAVQLPQPTRLPPQQQQRPAGPSRRPSPDFDDRSHADFGARIHAEFRDREDVTNAMHAARHAMLYPDYPPQTAKPQQRMGIGFAPPARLPPPIALPPPDMGRRHLHLPEHAPRLSYPHPNLLPGRGMGRDPGMPPWDHLPPPVGEHVPPYQPPGRYFGDYQ